MKSSYSTILQARNGSLIPLFSSGKSMHSRYNPEKEAEIYAENVKKADFYVISGIGAGFFIQKLVEKFPDAHFLCIEENSEDIQFLLSSFPILIQLNKNPKITFSSLEDLKKRLLEDFLPQLYPEFSYLEIRGWQNEHPESCLKLKEIIKESMDLIKKDFSVQCHFGKFFQHNILKNYSFQKKIRFSADTSKTCVILAAGPSLEKTLPSILSERNKYFIISTDTAFLSLSRMGFKSDTVISIDGQNISRNHFLSGFIPETLFVFDLSGNPQAVRYINRKGGKILFCSSHPLSFYIEKKSGKKLFLNLSSGAGTVTLSAVDLAFHLGFEKILLLGADFSYPYEKPYAKGTYFDSIFPENQNFFENLEKKYSSLIFRTETTRKNSIWYTELLDSYRQSLVDFMSSHQIKMKYENSIYELTLKNQKKELSYDQLEYNEIKNILNKEAGQVKTKAIENENLSDFEKALLPFMAFLRINLKNENNTFIRNLALEDFIKYN